jgi:hypothetical protein
MTGATFLAWWPPSVRPSGPGFPIAYRYSQCKGVDYTARIADTPGELEDLLTPHAGSSATPASCPPIVRTL